MVKESQQLDQWVSTEGLPMYGGEEETTRKIIHHVIQDHPQQQEFRELAVKYNNSGKSP